MERRQTGPFKDMTAERRSTANECPELPRTDSEKGLKEPSGDLCMSESGICGNVLVLKSVVDG